MKKLLLAAMSMAFVSNVYAADGADVKFSGEMRFRLTNVENTTTAKASNDNDTKQRTKVGAHFTKSEDLMAHVTLLHAATWGNEGTANTSGDFTVASAESTTYIHEAWAFWKAMDNFSVRLGRGALDIADGSVIAKNDWEQDPWAFEGALGTWYTEWANINLFGVKGMNDTSGADADVNFYGVSVDVKNLPEAVKMLNIHALQSKATGVSADYDEDATTETNLKDDKLRLGLTVKGDVSGFDYRGTYATYSGELKDGTTKVDNEGSMYDLEVGYTLPAMMNMRVSGLYHSDSGDKDAAANSKLERYDAFYYEQHSNAGLMDILNWGNLTYMKFGVALEPAEMVKAGVDYYMFTKTEKDGDIVGTANAGIVSVAASEDDLGSEIDLWVTKTLSNGAELNARYGMFQTGDAFGATKEDVTQMSVGATFKF